MESFIQTNKQINKRNQTKKIVIIIIYKEQKTNNMKETLKPVEVEVQSVVYLIEVVIVYIHLQHRVE
jgi:hypothetical protein